MGDPQDIDELLALARDPSRQARARLVDAIGDLYSRRETTLNVREQALMTEILAKLLAEFERPIRRALADRLAETPGAPPELIRLLANDEAEVARPVLMKSPVLREHELIEIVANRTREHQLAVAMREDLSEPVSDALVENGDSDVLRTLLENQSAPISRAAAAYLVEQARRVDSLQRPLVARKELGPDLAKRLYWYVAAALRAEILRRFEISEVELDDALESAAKEVSEREVEPVAARTDSTAHSPVWTLAERIAEERIIDARLVLKVLRRGEIPLFEALFGQMTGIRPPRLQHILYQREGKGLAVACKAVDIEKVDFAPIYLLSRKGRGGEQKVDPRELWRVLDVFERVSREDAVRILRRWQRDPNYLDAIEAVEDAEADAASTQGRG